MKRAVPLALAAIALVAFPGCGDDSGTAATARSSYPQWMETAVQGGRERIVQPTIALNCPVGNAYRCDRIVFAFPMRLPARHLEAWVAGRQVEGLRTAPYGGQGPRHGETGLSWSGHVQPAGMTEPGAPLHLDAPKPNYWAGTPPVRARVLVSGRLKSGQAVREIFPSVPLRPGYG